MRYIFVRYLWGSSRRIFGPSSRERARPRGEKSWTERIYIFKKGMSAPVLE